MEFRLIYEGPLPSASNNGRVKEKHAIRRVVHAQLAELRAIRKSIPNLHQIHSSIREIGKFKYLPVVTTPHACYVHLNILFLRVGKPGSILVNGDIDNRLKTLYDALRVPKNLNELPHNAEPEEDEEPFYCLLDDDSLITGHEVTADRLLVPSNRADEVRLVIHVHIEPQVRHDNNIGF